MPKNWHITKMGRGQAKKTSSTSKTVGRKDGRHTKSQDPYLFPGGSRDSVITMKTWSPTPQLTPLHTNQLDSKPGWCEEGTQKNLVLPRLKRRASKKKKSPANQS